MASIDLLVPLLVGSPTNVLIRDSSKNVHYETRSAGSLFVYLVLDSE